MGGPGAAGELAIPTVRSLVALLLAIMGLSIAAPCAAAERIVFYAVKPEIIDGALSALDVKITLSASDTGETQLRLPDHGGGATELWRYISDLAVDGGTLQPVTMDAQRVIESAPGADLTITYRVISAFDHDPDPRDFEPYKPIIRPHWFRLYGEALFALPEILASELHFSWEGPPDMAFASTLQSGAGAVLRFRDLQESVLVGGPELRLAEAEAAGGSVRFALIGRYGFTDQSFSDMAVRIISAERQFWKSEQAQFLVVLTPISRMPGAVVKRGEGRRGGIAMMTTDDVAMDALKTLIAHEYFHTWNPMQLGGMQNGPEQPGAYWFSEGFTEYYAWRLLLRSGEFSLQNFADKWNETLLAYATSPSRTEPNTSIMSGFWSDRGLQMLPYRRGAILAALWDRALQQESGGRVTLDDLMQAMLKRATALGEAAPTAPALFAEVARDLGLDVAPDIEHFVERGEAIQLPKDAFGACLAVVEGTIPDFDTGYDLEATPHGKIITGLKPDSPAFAAGLRDGMHLKFWQGERGNSQTALIATVDDNGTDRQIKFMPEGKGTISLQRISLPADMSAEETARCADQVANK